MPSLRNFSCRKFGLYGQDRGIVLNTPSSIEHLELLDYKFTPAAVVPLLLKCPSLLSLRVDLDGYGQDETNLYLNDLINSNPHLKETIQKLIIFDKNHDIYREEQHWKRYFPSLAHFQVLQKLKIEGYFIGTDEQENNPQVFSFASLPPSLEELTIWNATPALLIRQLNMNIHFLEKVPKLKRVCIRFNLRSDFWEPENILDIENEVWKEFAKSYAQQGVNLWCNIGKYIDSRETTQMRTSYYYDHALHPAWGVVWKLVVEKEPCLTCAGQQF